MNILYLFYNLVGPLLLVGILLFAGHSFFEKKYRAFLIILSFAVIFMLAWYGLPFLFQSFSTAPIVMLVVTSVVFILFFLPVNFPTKIQIYASNEQVDERDTAFAREEYEPGTEKYERYYNMRQELKEIDDRLRDLPPLLGEGGIYYDKDIADKIKSIFSKIKRMVTDVDGPINQIQSLENPKSITHQLKTVIRNQGAIDVGVTHLHQNYVYSHVGRGPEEWGSRIINNHKYAIVFAVEMDYMEVEKAPDITIIEETALKYLLAAEISVSLAKYIRSLGYSARAHISESNYQIILPAVAYEAGLGEIGRHGYLISPKSGSRLRLGGITTDLPMVIDKPITFGVQDFCTKCQKCADNCPPLAIPSGDKETLRGVEKWVIDPIKCLHYWRIAGSDCGLCMKVCPYSHPSTFVHDLVRLGIKRSAIARNVSIWGDDLLYGRNVKLKERRN
jgi:ferredoxin/uncharacterized membrane protein